MQGFVAKPEGQKLLAKPKGRWNDNEAGFLKKYYEGLGWNVSGEGLVFASFKHCNKVPGSIKFR
jgi:hypothetical protein